MKKVLFLASYYPNNVNKLNGTFIKKHAKAVSKNNLVTVVSAQALKQKFGKLYTTETIIEDNLKQILIYYNTHFISIFLLRRVFSFLAFFTGTLSAIFNQEKDYGKFNIIHIHVSMPIGIVAIWLKIFHKREYYLTEHGTNLIHGNFIKLNFVVRFIIKLIQRNSIYTTAVTKYHASEILKNGIKNNIIIIRNIVPNHPHLRNHNNHHKQIKLIHVSTLSPVKGVPEIIKCIQELNIIDINASLDIIGGDSGMISKLTDLSNSLGIGNQVKFYGWQTNEIINKMLTDSDIFILNSSFETFCVAAAEAISCGIPVVSPHLEPVEEFISEDRGFFFDPKKNTLAQSVKHVIDNYSLYDAAKLKFYISANFSEESIAESFEKLYSDPLTLEFIKLPDTDITNS